MAFDTIISTIQLQERLGTTDLVVLDCRFDLLETAWGKNEYQKEHIPGAFFADLNEDLSGAITPQSGRHPLPTPLNFMKKISKWGITREKQVVAYDANSGGFASRAWWLLKMYGFCQVAVLDGGWQKWQTEKRLTSTNIPAYTKSSLPAINPDTGLFVDFKQVLKVLGDESYRIIDVRAPERFNGEVEPIDPVAGHIPGAVNRPTSLNLTAEGLFKAPAELRAEILNLLENTSSQNAIIYCGSGVTSCHLILAMEIAGIPGARIYAGSWSEWIKDPERPVE